ncbi:MAG TPA: hypothetical protein VHN18_20600 [Micromonosporaceae bacterium]|nr:hypothetical protein [Micromonosporaceae bacterium]
MYDQDFDRSTRSPDPYAPGVGPSGTERAKATKEAAKQSAQEVAGTAKQQGRQVASEIRTQARSVAADVRSTVTGQARTQNDRLADGLRRMSHELGRMGQDTTGSPAGTVVSRLSDGGRRAADYLQERGPDGLFDDVQEFARRKPGTFLLAAAAAGFLLGRVGRTAVSAAQSDDTRSGYQPPRQAPRPAYDESPTLDFSTATTYGPGTTAPSTGSQYPSGATPDAPLGTDPVPSPRSSNDELPRPGAWQ